MTIEKDLAPGEVALHIDEQRYVLRLRMAEIERFEDNLGVGIFDVFSKFMPSSDKRASSIEVRSLLKYGLVGGGMEDRKADNLINSVPVGKLTDMYSAASVLLVETLTADKEAEFSVEEPGGPKG